MLPLDLAKESEQIDAIGPSVFDRFGRLDILVHAAGALGRLTPAAHILPEDWADVVAVNLAAVWRLIRTSAPLLQAADAGRAVFVTSGITRRPTAYWGAYGATKVGMEHLVLAWAEELRTTRVRVNLFDPGAVATRMRRTAFPGEDQTTLPTPAEVAPAIGALCRDGDAQRGARGLHRVEIECVAAGAHRPDDIKFVAPIDRLAKPPDMHVDLYKARHECPVPKRCRAVPPA